MARLIGTHCQFQCSTASPKQGCQASSTKVRMGMCWTCRQRQSLKRPKAWQQLLCRQCRRKLPPHMMCMDISPNQKRTTRQVQLSEECLPCNFSFSGIYTLLHPLSSCLPNPDLLKAQKKQQQKNSSLWCVVCVPCSCQLVPAFDRTLEHVTAMLAGWQWTSWTSDVSFNHLLRGVHKLQLGGQHTLSTAC